ncbi:Translation initiation factor IF-2 [Thelohanellus kitauei]|uniref:Translation initiation factor IF-2 n=1 Tax=Thelohanellus kitauei TaxID=669202 RepID=A0A0C2MAN4_THEKT|nr:Translation initiation factor IF-2 [Thelohanellus kitauei]
MILKNEKLCFIDTPGHSTFSNVRSRGVQSTDMVVLVIASDNGIQEQTVECINLIKAAITPFVICITKIDKKGTDIERIYNDLCKMGIEPEAVGGNVPSFEISALTGQGMKEFIEFLPKFAKKIDLSYDVTAPATGTIIDLRISSSLGKIATCILRQGKLKRGDLVSCGSTFAKVKQIILEDGKYANEVFASQPFHLVGWNSTPIPGEIFHLIDKNIKLKELQKITRLPMFGHSLVSGRLNHVGDSEYLTYDENNPLRINLLIKCDNYGSAEAVYQGIKHCNDPRVVINIYCCGIDNLETYTLLSVPESHTLIYTLNTEINSEAREILLKQKFAINSFEIIYKLFDHIKHYIQLEIRKAKVLKQVGAAKVLATFQLSGKLKRYVIGMKVCDGAFYNEKDVIVHIYRNNELLHQDTISSIKKLKTTVSVVNFGDECGISLKSPYKVKPGDDVVCYRLFPDERSVNWHY